MAPAADRFVPWSDAMRQALYGHGGFYHRPEGPAGHFRTSVHASSLFAGAVARLLVEVDTALGRPAQVDLVDVGAGRGELLRDVRSLLGTSGSLADRVRLTGVELAARPAGLPATVRWVADLPEDVVGLVVANEWLDDVPVDVVELGADGPLVVLVDPVTGHETPGGPVGLQDAGWLARWWPLDGARIGDRAEVGRLRDQAWAAAVASVQRGVAVAVDYGHLRAERVARQHAAGTLTGHRDGRAVAAVPDGSCDVTAHVAVDACAAAGVPAGAGTTRLLRQRTALRLLGVDGRRPPVELARTDPVTYADALAAASEAAELLDPDGLGAFWWVVQSVGDVPGVGLLAAGTEAAPGP
jgi:SAM-dependent MidA family methyltransferase